MIDRRRADLGRQLDELRKADGWHPFQNFVLGLLHHDGYQDVRHSHTRSDYGRDAVALTPDGLRCVVAVSFDCSKAKVLADAKRWREDPDREEASVLVFVTADAPQETTWSPWKAEVAALGLELRMFHRESILEVATRDEVWRETCARLQIPGDRPGFRLVAPYDHEVVRAALQARHVEWSGRRIELQAWGALTGEVRNRVVLGKPGAGKTTTLLFHLGQARPGKVLVVEPDLREEKVEELLDRASGGAVIVFDDAHVLPGALQALMAALRARQRDVPAVAERYRDVRLLLAARSQEWAEAQRQLSPTLMQDLGLLGEAQVRLDALSVDQCRALVEACRDAWGLVVEPRLVEQAATVAAERDATPLYVLSMLAPARARDDRTLRDEHLAHLPQSVLELWSQYWSNRLSPAQQGVLRLVKLFAVTLAPRSLELFNAAAKVFGLPLYEVSASLETLEVALWISLEDLLPSCLDVQLEAIPLDTTYLVTWDTFVHDVPAGSTAKIQLHLGTGMYQLGHRAPRTRTQAERVGAVEAALRHFSSVSEIAGGSHPSLRALALGNASLCLHELARLERTRERWAVLLEETTHAAEESIAIYDRIGSEDDLARMLSNVSIQYADSADLESAREGRAAWFQKAVHAAETSAAIRRRLGLRGDLAASLNNVAGYVAELARVEPTREGRTAWLRRAVEAAEESVAIQRETGAHEHLARSLNTASNCYADLAALEPTGEGRTARLRQAVAASEESAAIRRGLGFQADLAHSLNHLSVDYAALAHLEPTREAQAAWLRKAADAAEESSEIRRRLGLRSDLAGSLNNLASRYAELASSEPTRERRTASLRKAVEAMEESVAIRRGRGVDADLARSLNNVSNHYATLAELETTREGRLIWLRKAVDAVEDAIAMRRALGIQADLASSLHNVSNRYGEMAGLEPARDARRTWLQKAIHAAEEGVAIQDALGIRGAMAMSLNSMSNRCAQLAEMEPAREGWDAWLRKAIEAAEASVEIQRELGVPGDLAVSLGSLGNRFHMRASAETDRTRRMDDLRSSRDAAEEAGRLFRAAGEIKFLLLSLQDLVSAHGLLAEMGDPADVEILRALCLEGNQLARSMRDGEAEAFFTGILDWIE